MPSDEKGSFSIDAFFALTLLVIISGVIVNVSEGREQIASGAKAAHQADVTCEKLAAAINTVYANGPEFELRLDLADNIWGEGYTISFDPSTRQISVENLGGVTSGRARAAVVPGNVIDFELTPGDLLKTIKVYWDDDNIRVVST